MYWFKTSILLLLASPVFAIEGYIVGVGVESDTADGLSGVIGLELGLTEETWISATYSKNTVDLPRGLSLDTSHANLGLDHWFDPLGIRVGVSTWGDNGILDSNDVTGSLYWRGDRVTISGDYEFRDFEFNIPGTDFLAPRPIEFDATGVGLTTRFELGDTVSLALSGIDYDYSVNLRVSDNQGAVLLLSSTRLSIVNSLIDYRAGFGFSFGIGNQEWTLDYSQRKGAVDGTTTRSTTLRFLTPLGKRNDIEFGLGVDDSKSYGSVTFFSVFVYFYGGS